MTDKVKMGWKVKIDGEIILDKAFMDKYKILYYENVLEFQYGSAWKDVLG